eukprot:COSAG02_NODE_23681_length_711_cov_1.052288_1_plen_160_part_01
MVDETEAGRLQRLCCVHTRILPGQCAPGRMWGAVVCEQRRVVSARRVVFLQLAAAVGTACASNEETFDNGPVVGQQQQQQQLLFPPRRGLQAGDGTTAGNSDGLHKCTLCWMLVLVLFAGAAAALLQFCRHKRAEQGDEVKTPLSAKAASANPFDTPNDS